MTKDNFKTINEIELHGLAYLLGEHLGYRDILGSLLGTSANKLKNLENHRVDKYPPETNFTHLSSVGLTNGNNIILEFYDAAGKESAMFWVSYGDLIKNYNPQLFFKQF